MISLHHEKLEAKGRPAGEHRFLYFDQAFHGRTVFALNVTGIESAPLITKDLIAQVQAKAAHLEAGLCGLAERFGHLIFNPRGMGLYQGFTVRQAEWKARLLETALQDENILLLGAGRYSVRLRPAIDVTIADIDEMLSRLDRAMQRLSDEVAATCGTAA